jgi:hypothetical protein
MEHSGCNECISVIELGYFFFSVIVNNIQLEQWSTENCKLSFKTLQIVSSQ